MRNGTLRAALALMAFFVVVEWSRPAAADVTITGTVGEIGVLWINGNSAWFRFKLTDANQTAACVDPGHGGTKYAYFTAYDGVNKEWYAMLLVSKKGAQINCTLDNATSCRVKSCTLP